MTKVNRVGLSTLVYTILRLANVSLDLFVNVPIKIRKRDFI